MADPFAPLSRPSRPTGRLVLPTRRLRMCGMTDQEIADVLAEWRDATEMDRIYLIDSLNAISDAELRALIARQRADDQEPSEPELIVHYGDNGG